MKRSTSALGASVIFQTTIAMIPHQPSPKVVGDTKSEMSREIQATRRPLKSLISALGASMIFLATTAMKPHPPSRKVSL